MLEDKNPAQWRGVKCSFRDSFEPDNAPLHTELVFFTVPYFLGFFSPQWTLKSISFSFLSVDLLFLSNSFRIYFLSLMLLNFTIKCLCIGFFFNPCVFLVGHIYLWNQRCSISISNKLSGILWNIYSPIYFYLSF